MIPTTIRMIPTIPAGFTSAMLQRSPASNQLENENDQRNQEQDMDVGSENVESDESKQPQNQQNNKDSPKHKKPFVLRLLPIDRLAMRTRA